MIDWWWRSDECGHGEISEFVDLRWTNKKHTRLGTSQTRNSGYGDFEEGTNEALHDYEEITTSFLQNVAAIFIGSVVKSRPNHLAQHPCYFRTVLCSLIKMENNHQKNRHPTNLSGLWLTIKKNNKCIPYHKIAFM